MLLICILKSDLSSKRIPKSFARRTVLIVWLSFVVNGTFVKLDFFLSSHPFWVIYAFKNGWEKFHNFKQKLHNWPFLCTNGLKFSKLEFWKIRKHHLRSNYLVETFLVNIFWSVYFHIGFTKHSITRRLFADCAFANGGWVRRFDL